MERDAGWTGGQSWQVGAGRKEARNPKRTGNRLDETMNHTDTRRGGMQAGACVSQQ